MAQHDMNIINADGATIRGDINDALAALVSNNEGLSAPSPSYASMWWPDRTNGLLKQRNAANSAWIIRGTLADAPVEARTSNTILGVADYGKTILASGTWTQTLTAAATLGNGWWCEIRNDGAGTITLDPNASEMIDGASTITLAAGESCKVACDGVGIKTVGWSRASGKNAIINGNFAVNQLGKSGTVVLAAGGYGHDGWKAGASGCTYTFATDENVTTLTISAGSLMQTIDGLNVFGGVYTLSWAGTAQGRRAGVSSYAGSPYTSTYTGGSGPTFEFGAGTLSLVQFEPGSVATPFERTTYGEMLRRCQQYAQYVEISARANLSASSIFSVPIYFPPMRTTPSATLSSGGTVTNVTGTPSISAITTSSARMEFIASATGDTLVLQRRYLLEARL